MIRRKHSPDDEELDPLPPMDGEEDARDDAPMEGIDLDEGDVSLDDAPADDADLTGMDAFEDDPEEGDDEPWSDAPIGEDEGMEESSERWSDGRDEALSDGDDEVELSEPDSEGDRGEEGPEGEEDEALDVLPPLDDDDEEGDAHGAEELAVEAHEHEGDASGEAVRVRRMRGCAVAMGMSLGPKKLWVVGDGVCSIERAAMDDPAAALTPIEVTDDLLFTAVAEGDGGVFLGSIEGILLRRRSNERAFVRVFDGREHDARGPLEVVAQGRGVWCFARGQRLYHSPDGARVEPAALSEPVRALATDAHGSLLVATSRKARGALWKSLDGVTFRDVTPPDADAITRVACAGETLVAVPSSRAPGVVSIDGGGRWVEWACLSGATAIATVETDDGVVRVLYSLHDEAHDRASLFEASVSADGTHGAPRKIAVIDHRTLPSSDSEDESECKVDRIVPLDRAARRIALATARGVVRIERGE